MEQNIIRVSLDTLLIAFVPLIGCCFAGAWALLNSLVSKPIVALKEELAKINTELKEHTKSTADTKAEIMVINEWRRKADLRIERFAGGLNQ